MLFGAINGSVEAHKLKKEAKNLERRSRSWLLSRDRRDELEHDAFSMKMELIDVESASFIFWLLVIVSSAVNGLTLWGAIGFGWPPSMRESIGLLVLNVCAFIVCAVDELDLSGWTRTSMYLIGVIACVFLSSGLVWHESITPTSGHVAQTNAGENESDGSSGNQSSSDNGPNGILLWTAVSALGAVAGALGTFALIYQGRRR